jgi:hypothetical protein
VALTIDDAPLDDGVVGDFYQTTLTATGGQGSLHWAFANPDEKPRGLSLNEGSGTISGTPAPGTDGTARFTIMVTDATETAYRRFSLLIGPALQLSKDVIRKAPNQIQLIAAGGVPKVAPDPPYDWEIVGGTALPAGVSLHPQLGTVTIDGIPDGRGTSQITVRVSDIENHSAQQAFAIRVRPSALRLRHRLDVLGIRVRLPGWVRRLTQLTFWIAAIALVAPMVGLIPMLVYAFTTPGSIGSYLGVEGLIALASLIGGCLAGFLFGIPKVVSTGQARQTSGYTPSSNLAEVSDWLTKLLLGAGLIQLTHLGAPVGKLIHDVALGLYATGGNPHAAEVVAGSIMFGYMSIGLLDGYVVTTMWYQRKLASFNA